MTLSGALVYELIHMRVYLLPSWPPPLFLVTLYTGSSSSLYKGEEYGAVYELLPWARHPATF